MPTSQLERLEVHLETLRRRVALLCAAVLLASAPARAAWEPTKPVEIIVPAGAGGASDQMARIIQAAVTKHQLMKQPLIIQLKGGASGAEGMMDVKESPGDPHKFLIAQSVIYTIPLATKLPFNWRDLTPIAMIAQDEFVLWVNAETPYKTTQEYVAAVKAAKDPFKMGGTGSKREDHIITAAMEKGNGLRFTYIPYKSGGECSTQLVGKHIDSNVNNPSESVAQWRAGQVRALCVFDTEKMPYTAKVTTDQAWSDIPTCRSVGVPVDYLMLRSIFLPGKVTPDQAAYYVALFKKITATPEWKQYLETNALKPVMLTGPEFTKYLEGDEKRHQDLMAAAGFIAK
jgi:tripartite-type tricarboxylate transporter receptor subunit TctC